MRVSFPDSPFKILPRRSRSYVDANRDARTTRAWESFCDTVAPPVLTKIRERHESALAPLDFQHLDIPTSVGRVHARRSTSGSGVGAVIYVHGLSADSATSGPALSMFAGLYEDIAALDILCHGESEHVENVNLEKVIRATKEAAKYIARLQGRRVHLAGHSMGAFLTLHIGTDHDAPSWIEAMIVGQSPGISVATDAEREQAVELFKMERGRHAFTLGRRACPEHNVMLLPLVAAVAWQRFREPSVQTLVRSDVSSCVLPDERLRDCRVRVLLCWGENDGLVPLRHFEHLREVLPDEKTSVVTVPGIGHGGFADAHPMFADAIARFLHKVDGVERLRSAKRRRSSLKTVRSYINAHISREHPRIAR